MSFEPLIAARRFGTGHSPRLPPPGSVAELLAEPDDTGKTWPIPGFSELIPAFQREHKLHLDLRRARKDRGDVAGIEAALNQLRRNSRARMVPNLPHSLARAAAAPFGFHQRLNRFWADHFTVRGKSGSLRFAVENYVEEAIRPHITGSFATLLRAAVLHPMMILYLDQNRSIGPNSVRARRRGRGGLNENLARELLELHTLGVDGDYSQDDVTQLAELLTGLKFDSRRGTGFRPGLAEPGAEQIFGQVWGGPVTRLADIHRFLDHLATRADTARHIARKLCVHFVADTPDPALVAAVAATWRDTGGALLPVYETLLSHPAAMVPAAVKARRPFDYMVACLRALDIDMTRLTRLQYRDLRNYIATPLAQMGQPWGRPPGPDGWSEESGAWITARGLAERVNWAMTVPKVLRPDLPEPRALARLVAAASPDDQAVLDFVAQNAATRWEGTGLVLAAPVMQWR